MTDSSRLLTVAEAAAEMNMGVETLRRAIRAQRIACYRMAKCTRISREQIKAFLDASLCPAAGSTNPTSSCDADDMPSSGGKAANVAGFQLRQQMRAALDKPSRTSKPKLNVVP